MNDKQNRKSGIDFFLFDKFHLAKLVLKNLVTRGEKEDIFMENETTYVRAVFARKKK